MGASTKIEMDSEYDKDGYATSKSIILSKAMRKVTNWIARENICLIFTNQLRTRLGVSFGDQWTTSGGKAIAFHSSVRLRLKSVGQIKLAKSADKPEAVVGITTRAQVVKNRMGPPLRTVDYDIYFDFAYRVERRDKEQFRKEHFANVRKFLLEDKYLLKSNEGESIEDPPAMEVQIKVKVGETGKMEWWNGKMECNGEGVVQITTLQVMFSCFYTLCVHFM
jgi:RecA/RadA recombinase